MKGLKWRTLVVLATILFSIYLLIPTYINFSQGVTIPKVAKSDDPWYYHILPSESLKLGLDLKGGLHLVLGIDFNEVNRDAIIKLKNQMKDLVDREKIDGIALETTNDNKLVVHYQNDDQWKKVDRLIAKNMGQAFDFEGQNNNTAKLRMTDYEVGQVRDRAIEQSIETLRNRIDEFGIAEPILAKQGDEKIMLQFPGVQDPGRLKDIIARTAKLSFQIVRTGPEEPGGQPSVDEVQKMVDEYVKTKGIKLAVQNPITNYNRDLNAYLQGKIPAATELVFHKRVDVNTKEASYVPYLLDREPLLTGEDLEDARYGFDPQTNSPIVNFEMTPLGAGKFEKATGNNVHKYFAIVLDNNVHSAPRINERIGGGRAKIDMKSGAGRSQAEVMADAKDTSLVLRSGALPARLEFLEERVVGPALGRDAIKAGTLSLAAGLFLVFLFMAIYYRGSGVVADIALFLNGVFILAIMAAFEATMTLPGLAGITLTLGMAVDANVLIFEHLREEMRAGKSVATAIAEGYHRAFSAILDTHVTTIIGALILLKFGYGPIRGFAVTLLIGLSASLYTSVFITRLIQDYFVVSRGSKTLSV